MNNDIQLLKNVYSGLLTKLQWEHAGISYQMTWPHVIVKHDMAADMQSGADVTDSANVSPWVVLGDVALTITGMSRVN
jgi:hypothetical protein